MMGGNVRVRNVRDISIIKMMSHVRNVEQQEDTKQKIIVIRMYPSLHSKVLVQAD